MNGEPRHDGGWSVGPNDGSAPTVHLMPDGTATLDYQDPELYALLEDVVPAPLPVPDDGAAEPAVEPQPAVEPETEPTAVEPDGQPPEGAVGVLYETLAALGLDPDAAEYETREHWAGGQVASVVAHQLVDGRRTGVSWHAEIVEGEVYSFSGPLAPLVELGEYDVVSPVEAVERLADPRFGGAPVWSDVEVMPMLPAAPERTWGDPPAPPPAAGSTIPWPVTDATITSAEPVLIQHHMPDGSALLLPAYELSDTEGRRWSVLAVADHELAF